MTRSRVLAIGGTSHAGKSSVGQRLATSLEWAYVSTDRLAKHPGRPWGHQPGIDPPSHVVAHYRANTTVDLTDLLLAHFATMRDVVSDAVTTHLQTSPGVVIEGSALWPGMDITPALPVVSRWLVIDDDHLWRRMRAESYYSRQPRRIQDLIEAFRDRSIGYQQRLVLELRACGLKQSGVYLSGIETTEHIADQLSAELTQAYSGAGA